MKIKLNILTLVCFLYGFSAHAQTVNDLLELEAKVTAQRLKDELNKPKSVQDPVSIKLPESPTGSSPQVPVLKKKAVKVEPVTVAVFGVAPNYRAKINLGSAFTTVTVGSVLENKLVTRIVAEGVYMKPIVASSPAKKGKPKKAAITQEQFYPRVEM